jgi:hypothetical protein
LNQDRDNLERDIARLKALLESQPGLPAEAVVQAEASLLAADTLMPAMDTAEGDVAAPLATALYAFAEKADLLVVALGRLPEF